MRTFDVKEILSMDKADVWRIPPGPLKLVFPDGILETSMRPTLYSRYIWDIARKYPGMQLLKRHHMQHRVVDSKLQIDMLGELAMDALFTQVLGGIDMRGEIPNDYYPPIPNRDYVPDQIGLLGEAIYDVMTDVYNDFIIGTEKYVRSISIRDVIEIIDHPVIANALAECEPTEEAIEQAYTVIGHTIKTDTSLHKNSLALYYLCGNVKPKQMLQMIAMRGFMDDVDSTIYPNPSMASYTTGLSKLEDNLMESRSASKALMNNGKQLEDSEVSNREQQLIVSVINNVYYTNCGTTSYDLFSVRDEQDLRQLAGIYRKLPNGNISPIKGTEKELIGTTIEIRTINHCKCGDPYGVCAVCLGLLSYAIGKNTNLGHVSSTTLGHVITQHIMSTKHHDGSGRVEPLSLLDYYQKFICNGAAAGTVFINRDLDEYPVKVILKSDHAKHVTDIFIVDDVHSLSLERTSSIAMIQVSVEKLAIPEVAVIPTCVGKRPCALSHDILQHMKDVGWELTDHGDYIVDLTKFDRSKPILIVPSKRLNMGDYLDAVTNVTQSPGKGKSKRGLRTVNNTSQAVMMLHDAVKSESNVNIAHIAVIVRSMQATDINSRNFCIPLPSDQPVEYASLTDLMTGRSIGHSFAHKLQGPQMLDPRSYIHKLRPNSYQDRILQPSIPPANKRI